MSPTVVDYNQSLTPGDVDGGFVNVVVEIPLGGTEKIEWDRKCLRMKVDRQESTAFHEPTNYGFVPQTIGGDGDSLDALIISDDILPTETVLSAKVIGVMKFDDEGQADDKVVVVPTENPDDIELVKEVSDLPEKLIDEITNYFTHYKDQDKPGSTKVIGWGDAMEAKAIIHQAVNRWHSINQ
jgi:inorganic pyrophosphatase